MSGIIVALMHIRNTEALTRWPANYADRPKIIRIQTFITNRGEIKDKGNLPGGSVVFVKGVNAFLIEVKR